MSDGLPSDFTWGVATSAYQIEGAVHAHGRGESIWDRFCRQPGRVRAAESGEIACDFYHRYPEDIALMRDLGVDAFRFSVAWPRVIPDGTGPVNDAGLDFYERLVDALLEAGIEPFVNLFHWDLPQPLEDAGGWPERATAEAFVRYAETVATRLGDRVRYWITHNEPYCTAWLGYGLGIHAPGRTSVDDALAAAHHALLSHGWTVEALRSAAPGCAVGTVIDYWPAFPASDAPEDAEAARIADGIRNRWFFDPVLRGEYPADVMERLAAHAPPVRDGDMEAIAAPLDFLGLNNYSRMFVRADPGGGLPLTVRGPDGELTDTGWEIYPDALREGLVRLDEEYDVPPLYVSESGAAFSDVVTHDGAVHDLERIDYLDAYLAAATRAVEAGVDLRGFFVWSLLDNFEWSLGYAKRFGLVYVDYPTLERTPKDSFHWYADRIRRSRSGGVSGVAEAHVGEDAMEPARQGPGGAAEHA